MEQGTSIVVGAGLSAQGAVLSSKMKPDCAIGPECAKLGSQPEG